MRNRFRVARVITVGCLAWTALVIGATDAAGQPAKAPIGRFVADVRGSSAGLPAEPGWTPAVPAGTVVPTRGWGLEAGAHVYLFRLRGAAIGLGGSWVTARGSSSPPEPSQTGGTTAPATPRLPTVTTRITALAPQLSLNFGHSLGWSYLSAGLGRARSHGETSVAAPGGVPRLESDWVKALNFGGGARWFVNDHVGFGFDVRWHKLSLVGASATHPGAPRASLLVAGAGLVLK
jgi:hypothetical protein